jgi:hypothetical protein
VSATDDSAANDVGDPARCVCRVCRICGLRLVESHSGRVETRSNHNTKNEQNEAGSLNVGHFVQIYCINNWELVHFHNETASKIQHIALPPLILWRIFPHAWLCLSRRPILSVVLVTFDTPVEVWCRPGTWHHMSVDLSSDTWRLYGLCF